MKTNIKYALVALPIILLVVAYFWQRSKDTQPPAPVLNDQQFETPPPARTDTE